jgi:hypothetical protein
MRTHAAAASVALALLAYQVAAFGDPTGTDPPIRRGAVSGERQQVLFEYSVEEDCRPCEPRVRAEIEAWPAHGNLTLSEGEGFPLYPKDNPAYKCNGTRTPGVLVHYQSVPGYSGPDTAAVRFFFPSGETRLRVLSIDVWERAEPISSGLQ